MHRRNLALLVTLAALLQSAAAVAQNGDMEAKSTAPPPDLAARALGVDPGRMPEVTAEQAALAKAIGREVVCLCGTCPKHTITDCDCGWAGMNKRTLQLAVAKGTSRDEIVQIYRNVYGDQVLAMLPNEGFARAAWLLPYTAGLLGLVMVFFVGVGYLRRTRRGGGATAEENAGEITSAATDDTRAQLIKELEELD